MSDAFLNDLAMQLREFARERDWEQFHSPKNLAMALVVEGGELLEQFQWLTPEESMEHSLTDEQRKAIELEIADVQIYLRRLADVLNVDIPEVVREKIQINNSRF